MELTLKNIWDNRGLFIKKCKKLGACKDEFKRLLQAQSKEDFMQVVWDNYNWVNRKITQDYPYAYDFHEGFAKVKLDNKYGFIANQGNVAIPIIYDDAWNFHEGFAKVKLDNKYGFIANQGNVAIPIIYDFAYFISEGLAEVRLNGKFFKINKNNERVAE